MDVKRIAVIMATTGRNNKWLNEAIISIKNNEKESLKIDIFLHFDGCQPVQSAIKSQVLEGFSYSEKCVGLGDSMNKCCQMIIQTKNAYDYIARMDDDDLILPDKFEKQVAFMLANPDIDFSSTLCQMINEEGVVTHPAWDYAKDDGRTIEDRFLAGGCHIVHAATMFKASMLYDRGHLWYNPLFRQVEDYDLWFRLIRLGYKYKLLPEYLYQYRIHQKQETRNNNGKKNLVCSLIHGFYTQAWGLFLCER